MPPIRSLYVTEPPTQPTMGPVTALQRLRDLYNDTLKGFVPADVVKALLPSQDVTMPLTTVLPAGAAAEFAEQNLAEPVKRTLRAFHGSPHDFDQFSLSKIGTGEGAQAYGHGLYFAENPSVAAGYKKAGIVDPRDTMNQVISLGRIDSTRYGGDETQLREVLRSGLSSHPELKEMADSPEILNHLVNIVRGQEANGTVTPSAIKSYQAIDRRLGELPKGRTYEVNIHASPDELLDWDKPLSQQPPKVQEALESLHYPNGPISTPMKVDKSARTGGELYSAMHENYTGTPEHAAELLKAKGIKGIQYLDQGSRRIGQVVQLGNEGKWFYSGSATPYPTREAATAASEAAGNITRNFVIFDDKIIEIAKKYGLSLPVAASLYKWQQSQQKQKGVE